MARFTIQFESDPMASGPWQGRKSARVKMMQSITDYLRGRCGCTNVTMLEMIDTPAEEVAPAKSRKRAS